MERDFIIPGQEIGGYRLNWSFRDLEKNIPQKTYKIEKHKHCWVIHYNNFSFWLNNKNGKITQIGVYGSYSGTFKGIGIGSTLEDVKLKIGAWKEDLDVYVIPKYKGISFELADNEEPEEWIEEKMPIEAIYIYTSENEKGRVGKGDFHP